jgi:hypothetical protein
MFVNAQITGHPVPTKNEFETTMNQLYSLSVQKNTNDAKASWFATEKLIRDELYLLESKIALAQKNKDKGEAKRVTAILQKQAQVYAELIALQQDLYANKEGMHERLAKFKNDLF